MSFKNHGNDFQNRRRLQDQQDKGLQSRPLEMKYGTDGTHVVIQFNIKIDNVKLTEEQALGMIDLLTKTIGMMQENRKAS